MHFILFSDTLDDENLTAEVPGVSQSGELILVTLLPINESQISSGNATGEDIKLTAKHAFSVPFITLIVILGVSLIAVIVAVGLLTKVVVEGYKRRHYQKIDYLVEGMYSWF